jgi:hypothetical protein
VNGKTYIGKHQTKNLNDGYLGSGKLLRRAIKKYGAENFRKVILHIFDNEADMNRTEAELVVVSEETYNLCPGGQGGWGYINKEKLNIYPGQQDQARENMKIAQKALHVARTNPEFLSRMNRRISEGLKGRVGAFKGKTHTAETKTKIGTTTSIKQKGDRNSQYGSRWINNPTTGEVTKTKDITPWLAAGWRLGRVTQPQGM